MTTVLPAQTSAPAASVTPPVSPATRLRPALVNGSPIHLACPSWCTEDHVAANQRHLEDVAHTGENVDLVVPGGRPSVRLLADIHLSADPFAPTAEGWATVVVVDDDSDMFQLSAEEAESFADHLEAQAREIRGLAAVARRDAAV
jgi:hypothetical protein